MTSRRRPLGRRRVAHAVIAASLVGTLLWAGFAVAAPAGAPVAADELPVLIVDAGLGDSLYLTSHWLGQEQDVASSGAVRLLTSPSPVWWGGPGSPDTYVLTSSDASGSVAAAPLRSGEIAWALDRIAERHPAGKAVIVANGTAGLQARAYLENLGSVRESDRADVVGLVLVGTPNGGLDLAQRYPMLDLWEPVGAGAGLAAADLVPGSPFLASLDAGRIPGVVHTLVIQGAVVELGGTNSDGVTVLESSQLATGVAQGPLSSLRVRASASQGWPLSDSWFAATKQGGLSADPVDGRQVALLQSASSYAMSKDVASAVRKFYEASYANGAPTTHISTRLVMDVSGSMAEGLGKATKLDAAKRAASDFTASLSARQALAAAVPEDIGLVAFNEKAEVVAAGGASPADVAKRVAGLKASGNTDVGNAVRVAVESFAQSPKPADKVVVLLSDGVNTAGLDEKGILSGPVKTAASTGIRIETIALGGVDDADVEFLKQIASATGGSFHRAKDLFELRRDFLRARYTSIGQLVADTDVDTSKTSSVDLGAVDGSVRLLEVAAVDDRGDSVWQLMRDGKPVAQDELALSTRSEGVTSIAVTNPKSGSYSLVIAGNGGSSRSHIFAVQQVESFEVTTNPAPPDNTGMLVLIGLGAVAGIAVVGTVVVSSRAGRARRKDVRSESTGGSHAAPPAEDGGH